MLVSSDPWLSAATNKAIVRGSAVESIRAAGFEVLGLWVSPLVKDFKRKQEIQAVKLGKIILKFFFSINLKDCNVIMNCFQLSNKKHCT